MRDPVVRQCIRWNLSAELVLSLYFITGLSLCTHPHFPPLFVLYKGDGHQQVGHGA